MQLVAIEFLFFHSAASMILEITYGYTVENVDDSFIRLADEAAVESFRYGGPGATLCDALPIREDLFTLLISVRPRLKYNSSKTLANVDAILFLPATCSLYQDPRRETVYLAALLG